MERDPTQHTKNVVHVDFVKGERSTEAIPPLPGLPRLKNPNVTVRYDVGGELGQFLRRHPDGGQIMEALNYGMYLNRIKTTIDFDLEKLQAWKRDLQPASLLNLSNQVLYMRAEDVREQPLYWKTLWNVFNDRLDDASRGQHPTERNERED